MHDMNTQIVHSEVPRRGLVFRRKRRETDRRGRRGRRGGGGEGRELAFQCEVSGRPRRESRADVRRRVPMLMQRLRCGICERAALVHARATRVALLRGYMATCA